MPPSGGGPSGLLPLSRPRGAWAGEHSARGSVCGCAKTRERRRGSGVAEIPSRALLTCLTARRAHAGRAAAGGPLRAVSSGGSLSTLPGALPSMNYGQRCQMRPSPAYISAGSGWPWAAAPCPPLPGFRRAGGRPWLPSRCRARPPQTIVQRAGRSRPARTRARSSSSPCRPPFGSRGPGCGWRPGRRRRRSARW